MIGVVEKFFPSQKRCYALLGTAGFAVNNRDPDRSFFCPVDQVNQYPGIEWWKWGRGLGLMIFDWLLEEVMDADWWKMFF